MSRVKPQRHSANPHKPNKTGLFSTVRCGPSQKSASASPATTRALFSFRRELATEDHEEGQGPTTCHPRV